MNPHRPGTIGALGHALITEMMLQWNATETGKKNPVHLPDIHEVQIVCTLSFDTFAVQVTAPHNNERD